MNKSDISIIITESDTIIRDNMSEYLESFGYAIDTASRKDELFSLMSIKPSQIVLLECGESEKNAIDTIYELNTKYPSTIVMVMLSNPSIDRILHFVNLGIQHILIKPLSLNDVEKSIKKAVLHYENNYVAKLFRDNKELILKILEEQGVEIFNSQEKNLTTPQEV